MPRAAVCPLRGRYTSLSPAWVSHAQQLPEVAATQSMPTASFSCFVVRGSSGSGSSVVAVVGSFATCLCVLSQPRCLLVRSQIVLWPVAPCVTMLDGQTEGDLPQPGDGFEFAVCVGWRASTLQPQCDRRSSDQLPLRLRVHVHRTTSPAATMSSLFLHPHRLPSCCRQA